MQAGTKEKDVTVIIILRATKTFKYKNGIKTISILEFMTF